MILFAKYDTQIICESRAFAAFHFNYKIMCSLKQTNKQTIKKCLLIANDDLSLI